MPSACGSARLQNLRLLYDYITAATMLLTGRPSSVISERMFFCQQMRSNTTGKQLSKHLLTHAKYLAADLQMSRYVT